MRGPRLRFLKLRFFGNSGCTSLDKKRDSSGQIGVKADERPGYLQPSRSLGDDYAGSATRDQAVFESGGFEGVRSRSDRSVRGSVLPALGTDECRPSGWGRAV